MTPDDSRLLWPHWPDFIKKSSVEFVYAEGRAMGETMKRRALAGAGSRIRALTAEHEVAA